jgi:pimeloyl-ACP methyl ester carboxylesterase
MDKVVSRDGTPIAYERTGTGPALVVVDAAGNFSGFRPLQAPVEQLAADFTVYVYDRRGRGGSGDTPPYAPEREVEDVAALITAAGGTAYVYGMSSGCLVALRAAAAGLAIPRLALFEPALDDAADTAFTEELAALVAAGRRRDAVEFFHRGIGVPDEVMAETPPDAWAALESVAHTLVYDCRLSDATALALVRAVPVPTLVLASQASPDEITGMAAAVARALPDATHRRLPGQWHGADPDEVAAALRAFLLRA